jgi:hypothetical protein
MTSFFPTFRAFFAMFACALLLAACISGKPEPETYTNKEGQVTTIESDKDLCIRSCNDDYERCSDRGTTYQFDRSQDVNDIYGVSATCRDELKACLPRCKGR